MPHWQKVMDLVRNALGEGRLTEEATWQVVVLIRKGKEDCRGIGLVEVEWKIVAAILNCSRIAYITYHNFLHIFRAGRGTGTATLEVKMLQKLAAMREEFLYTICMYPHKAYDALDRNTYLEILEGYGVGNRACRTLWTYYGKEFKGLRGVTQGGTLSPTIFNMVVDAVIWHWL